VVLTNSTASSFGAAQFASHTPMIEYETETIMTKLTLKNRTAAQTVSEQICNDQAEAQIAHVKATSKPTAASIALNIQSAMDLLADTFVELEPKIVGTNGKHYAVDASLPAGVEPEADLDVNKWSFIRQQITSVVVWKLETMFHRTAEQVADQRKQIVDARRALDMGRGDESFVLAKLRYLDRLEEQLAMVLAAFEAAQHAHYEQLGTYYEVKSEREVRKAGLQAKSSSGLDAEMAKRGL
jgi:hypothetical protein